VPAMDNIVVNTELFIIKYLTKENSFFFYILMDLLGFDIVNEFLLGGESFRTQNAKEIEKCHNFNIKRVRPGTSHELFNYQCCSTDNGHHINKKNHTVNGKKYIVFFI
jgi:hypothetical protein